MFVILMSSDSWSCFIIIMSLCSAAHEKPSQVFHALSCSVANMYMLVSVMFSSTNVGCSGQSEWELLSVTPFSQLGSEERVSLKKMQREERDRQMEKKLRRAEGQASVQQVEVRVLGVENKVQRKMEWMQQAEARADELQRRLDDAEGRVQEKPTVQQKVIVAKQEIGWNDGRMHGSPFQV